MNPCLRAIVRSAIASEHEVIGIRRGYQGLLDEDFYVNSRGEQRMGLRTVSNLSKLGGTMLRSSRSDEFRTEAGLKKAVEVLKKQGIDALIPIGGDGTFHGAVEIARRWDGQIIGCPGTIDNDLIGTDFTIGFATAVATSVDALDKLRDTAESHERMFLVEVMGRYSGYIALYTALAGGAEVVAIPETETNVPQIVQHLQVLKARGKKSIMIVVSEGDEKGGAEVLNEGLKKAGCPYQTRVLTLGHLQRGGTPVPEDRILASRLGDFAVQAITEGETGMMAGEVNGNLILTPLPDTYSQHKPVPQDKLDLLQVLAS